MTLERPPAILDAPTYKSESNRFGEYGDAGSVTDRPILSPGELETSQQAPSSNL